MLTLEDLTDEEKRLLLQRLIQKTPPDKTVREFFNPEEIAHIAEEVVRETRDAQGAAIRAKGRAAALLEREGHPLWNAQPRGGPEIPNQGT